MLCLSIPKLSTIDGYMKIKPQNHMHKDKNGNISFEFRTFMMENALARTRNKFSYPAPASL